jgi:arylsulfatase A-like enzyme/putative intracellular protease/amidase
MSTKPDVIILLTDEERAIPSYESEELRAWREKHLVSTQWFRENAVSFERHYTGSLACVPSRPTLFTGHYPDLHGVTQTDGLGKVANDSRMRWLPQGEVPTLGNWFRAAGYDTHYDGKWHISHADIIERGKPLATNRDDGKVIPANVERYLEADPLAPYGFSGWIGPEPHGAKLADSGFRRDPLLADRIIAWLTDRYDRRREGETAAQRPFLLVASFVNPHDIVLYPAWRGRRSPLKASPLDPPDVPESPTDHEDLSTKPSAQVAYRAAYPSGYGPPAAIERIYREGAQDYRNLYYRLHAEVDKPLERVRRSIDEQITGDTVIVRTADHGELLGAHGGLHQKWFNLYDEATRIPMFIARIGGESATAARTVSTPTSHVDLVPTLLAAAGIDELTVGRRLRKDFTEVHTLPGRNLMEIVEGATTGATSDAAKRAVYLLTRDNMLEGDSGASGLARRLRRTANPPMPLRIQVAAHTGANFEGVVARVDSSDAPRGGGHLWKLVRTFDDPATWTSPGVAQLAANGIGGRTYRRDPLPDEWELYDLDDDPTEATNRATDDKYRQVFEHLQYRLKEERATNVPERNNPWPYAARNATPTSKRPRLPARALRRLVRRVGMHPELRDVEHFDLHGKRALVVGTNHGVLDVGKATGVFASELTVPYYAFLDAGMDVDVASPLGGAIPVDPMSLKPVIRSAADDRFLADDTLRRKVNESRPIGALEIGDYDLIFLAGGWGAAFDFATSEELAAAVTAAAAADLVIGGICHGPLGLVNATAPDGTAFVAGRKVSAVTDKQVRELGIASTPFHPETELRKRGAEFSSEQRFRDPFANHWVVDGTLVTGQNQNAGPMVAQEMMRQVAARIEAPSEEKETVE